jgi:hypothetical protein
MPRPISWLPRIHEIRRTVGASVRSHYERKEIEALFLVQARTAQLLLEILPTVAIGRSRLVEREALIGFLRQVGEAEDPSAEFERIRRQGAKVSLRKPRTLVRRDIEPFEIDALPENIEITQGRMTVSFRTIEQLVETMYSVARAIETDGDELARRFEIRDVVEAAPERDEFEAMMQELEALERASLS